MENYLIRAIDKHKSVRIFIAKSTQMVQEIRNIHNSSATGSAAMGRLATMAAIMGIASLDDSEKLTIIFDGKGIGGRLTAVTNSKGQVKVTASNPQADPASKYPGKLDVSKFIGLDGNLNIIKDLGLKEPYVGVSNIVTGEIAEDMANYFFYSEQTPSIVSLGVLVDKDLSIRAAGGLFVQVLPDALEEEIQELENIVTKLQPISEMIDQGLDPEDILEKYFSKMEPTILDKQEISLKCDCNRERIQTGIESLGKAELEKIKEEDGKIEVVCDFCKTVYEFNEKDLSEMIDKAR